MTYPDMPAARADHHHQQHDGHPQQQPLRFPQRRHFPTTRQPDDSAILEDINFGSEDLLTDLGSRRKSDTSKGVRYQSGSGNIDNVVVMPPQYVERSSVVISDSGNQTASTSSATCSSHAIGFRSFCENDIEPIAKVKCVLVGDGAVGKTSLIVSYTTNGYPSEYVPTAFDNYSVEVTVDCKPVRLQLCDTPGQDDFDTLRILCYPDTDVFLLCFSVVSPTSFQNIKDKWASEISQYAPKTPVILVGTQCDLRDDVKVLIALNQYGEKPVSELEALDCCKKIGALTYIESSSLTQKNLKDVFDTVILAALNWDGYRKKLCRKESKRYSKRRKKFLNAKSDDKELISETDQSRPKKHGWRKYLCMS